MPTRAWTSMTNDTKPVASWQWTLRDHVIMGGYIVPMAAVGALILGVFTSLWTGVGSFVGANLLLHAYGRKRYTVTMSADGKTLHLPWRRLIWHTLESAKIDHIRLFRYVPYRSVLVRYVVQINFNHADVPVLSSWSYIPSRRVAEALALAIKVPLVETRFGVKTVRDGASVHALLRDSPPPEPPVRPEGSRIVEAKKPGLRYAAHVPAPRTFPNSAFWQLGFTLALAVAWSLSRYDHIISAGVIALAFGAVWIPSLLVAALSHQDIEVTDLALVASTTFLGVTWRRRVMPLATLEELVLETFQSDKRRFSTTMHAVSDYQEVELAPGLNEADARYLRARLCSAIAVDQSHPGVALPDSVLGKGVATKKGLHTRYWIIAATVMVATVAGRYWISSHDDAQGSRPTEGSTQRPEAQDILDLLKHSTNQRHEVERVLSSLEAMDFDTAFAETYDEYRRYLQTVNDRDLDLLAASFGRLKHRQRSITDPNDLSIYDRTNLLWEVIIQRTVGPTSKAPPDTLFAILPKPGDEVRDVIDRSLLDDLWNAVPVDRDGEKICAALKKAIQDRVVGDIMTGGESVCNGA